MPITKVSPKNQAQRNATLKAEKDAIAQEATGNPAMTWDKLGTSIKNNPKRDEIVAALRDVLVPYKK